MRLTISLDDDLYRYVKQRAKNEDVSMSAVINALVRLRIAPPDEAIALPRLSERWPVVDGAASNPLPTDEAARAEEEDDLKRLGWKP
ncbi:MAG: ribbon-helix-helix protein, CopG family [Archangium sp.]